VSKVYVVQPEKGELPYHLVDKRPLAFYREVMESNVKEHKISKSPTRQRPQSSGLPHKKTKTKRKLQYNNVIKKRSVAQVLTTVRRKLNRLLSEVTEHSPDQIDRALSNPDAERVL